MIQYLYLGRVDYAEGLALQAEIAALVTAGRLGNVLLLLEHPPVLTLGRNGNRANVLASDELLAARGMTLHTIDRGGDVTYHGPGQLVGYPIFDLRSLRGPGTGRSGGRMGPVDFVRGMEEALIRVCATYGVSAGRVAGLTGVWCGGREAGTKGLAADELSQTGAERKIGAIGIHVSRGITSHGFAFNVTTDLRDFNLIVPCGIADHAVTSLELEMQQADEVPSLATLADAATRAFGLVFDQPVQAVRSLAALRTQAGEPPAFPAQDTPLQTPPEIERLHGVGSRPVRA